MSGTVSDEAVAKRDYAHLMRRFQGDADCKENYFRVSEDNFRLYGIPVQFKQATLQKNDLNSYYVLVGDTLIFSAKV